MKQFAGYGVLLLIIFFSIHCSEKISVEAEPLPTIDYNALDFGHSMKGWELYSWPNGDDWNYSLIVGTNSLKSYNMVTGNPVSVKGIDSLKKVLERMPEGEEIFWIGENWLSHIWNDDYKDLRLPPENIVSEIERFCQEHGLIMTVTD